MSAARRGDGVGAVVVMGAVVVLATLAIHGLLHSLMRDFGSEPAASLLWLYLLWLVPLGYFVVTLRTVDRRRREATEGPVWPWVVTVGLVALSVLIVSCFALVFG